ncbi:MAG TPA: hypothetical protein VIK86_05590 [Candidatus Paceibacterota bacterium]
MAYQIDPTYFVRGISIPNNTGNEQINLSIDSNIDSFIAIYEPEFLTTLLGSVLYAEFIAGLAVVPIDAKWTNLKNQLLNTTLKTSPIANYVYFHLANNEIRKGQLNDNPTFFNNERCCKAWDDMVKMNHTFLEWMFVNDTIYTSFSTRDDNYYFEYSKLFKTINTLGI